MRWVLALVLVALVAAQYEGDSSYYEPCTISGDPHFRMFGSGGHDFQGRGLYEILNHKTLEIQSFFEYCSGKITCLRSTTLKFNDGREGSAPIVVYFGTWPGKGVDPIQVAGVTHDPAKGAFTVQLDNKYTVSYSSGRLTVSPPVINGKKRQGWSISMGQYSLMIAAPINDPEFDRNSCGVCGDLQGDPAFAFKDPVGRVYNQGAKANARVNGKSTNEWAQSFNVSSNPADGSRFKPILPTVPQRVGSRWVMSAVPTAVMVQSDEEDKANVEAKFPTLEALNDAKAFCDRQCANIADPGQKKLHYDNCLFDYGRAVADPATAALAAELAASSPTAALSAQALNPYVNEESGPSKGAVAAAVVCSIIAAAGIAVALFYYFRSRRLQEDLTKALVPINTPLTGGLGAQDNNVNLSVASGI